MKKHMVKAKAKKKNSNEKAQNIETRIVEMSLQHPELGARRLISLLKKKRISVSVSAAQSILCRRGLQTSEKRMAQIKKHAKKARRPKPPPKKALPKITDDVSDCICKISLQHPNLGAKSLAPLLKEKGLSVSSSAVYRILKHHELHTRAKRYAKAAEITSQPVIIPKTCADKIPPEVENRIVEISLQIPDCGVRRLLPLLQQEEIFVSISAVYRILKRNNLENRQKRLLKLVDALQAPEVQPEPEIEAPEPVAVAPAEPERPPLRKLPVKPFKIRSHPVFYPLYLLLFTLIGYLGFYAVRTFQYTRLETESVSAAEPAARGIIAKTEKAAFERPLDGYRRIWERNLFNIARAGNSEPAKEIPIEEIALAKKDLGLKLVGTVMSDDAGLRRAFIDNSRTRKQKAYREGDAAGGVRIKKILRSRVIVGTAEGDRLLLVDIGGSSGSSNLITYAQQRAIGAQYPQQIAGHRRPGISFTLAREDIVASLADIDKLEQQLNIEPFIKDDQPAGFTIGNIPPESILRKMGLKSGNAIMGVNDEAITGPEQAAEFFQKLAQGGEKTIKARIGRGVRSRTRYFHLNIE